MGRKVGGKFKREGTYVYLWLIHADVWQKPTQYCKAIILQLQIIFFKKAWSQMLRIEKDEGRKQSMSLMSENMLVRLAGSFQWSSETKNQTAMNWEVSKWRH